MIYKYVRSINSNMNERNMYILDKLLLRNYVAFCLRQFSLIKFYLE